MQRAPHLIQHDYKPRPSARVRFHRLYWFAVGLGLPFLVLLVTALLRSGSQADAAGSAAVSRHRLALPPPLTSSPGPSYGELVAEAAGALASSILPPAGELLEFEIRRGDSLDRLFRQHGLDRADLAEMMRLKEAKQALVRLHPGDRLAVRHEEGTLLSLSRRLSMTETLVLERAEAGFRARRIEHPVERRLTHAEGRIENSLFEAAAAGGISDKVIMNLAGVFAWDIDFVLDIRQGDEFLLVYEQLWQDGERIGDGEVIAAEFANQGRTHRALRYEFPDGRTDYFTPEGMSVRKAFLRAPVDFSRISSNFNPRRLHPILKTVRPHRGVDYAAPTGTPIKAAGDGKVVFRGRKNGYGNAIELQHGGNITTLYAHLSRFAGSMRVGSRVKQGQTIGYVGQTGLATAPHLHYEYRLNGAHRNPRTVKLPEAEPIPLAHRQDFLLATGPLLARLDALKRAEVFAVAGGD